MTRNSDFSFQKCDKCVKETSSGWGRGTPWFISKKCRKFLYSVTIIGTLTQPHFKFPAKPNHYLFFPMYLMDLKIWTSFKNWNNMVWMYCVLTDQILWIIRNRYCILWIPDWGFIIKWKVDEEIVKIPQENLQKDLFTTAYTVHKSANAANANAWTHTNDPVGDYHCISKFEGCFIAIIRWWSWKHTKYSKNVLIVPLFVLQTHQKWQCFHKWLKPIWPNWQKGVQLKGKDWQNKKIPWVLSGGLGGFAVKIYCMIKGSNVNHRNCRAFCGFLRWQLYSPGRPTRTSKKGADQDDKKTNKRQYRIWGEGKFYNFMLGSRVTRFWNINIV